MKCQLSRNSLCASPSPILHRAKVLSLIESIQKPALSAKLANIGNQRFCSVELNLSHRTVISITVGVIIEELRVWVIILRIQSPSTFAYIV